MAIEGGKQNDIWTTRSEALAYLNERQPSRVDVVLRTFELLDDTIDAFDAAPPETAYPRICGLTLLKAKNLALGAYSLVLDGLGQESGALLRPMIEYVELLTYFRLKPEMTERAVENSLPKAGERAKAIEGMFKDFRDHLNREASHSSFSRYSIGHLFERDTFSFKKRQRMVPTVLERNLRDLVVQLHNLLDEAILTLEYSERSKSVEIAVQADRLKRRMFDVFDLNSAGSVDASED